MTPASPANPGARRERARAQPGPARAAALARLRATTLSLAAPDPLAADALERAKTRLAAVRACPAADRPGAQAGRSAAWVGLACLATGQLEPAAAVLRDLARRAFAGATAQGACEDAGAATREPSSVLAAAYAAWTADLATSGGHASDDPTHDPALAPGPRPGRLFAPARESLAAYAACRPETGFRDWWACVRHLLAAEPEPPEQALAHRLCADSPPAVSAANVILPLVYGLLGAEPDALRHRLRLRPQLPAAWDRLEIERLRVGDAELSLRYGRQGARHVFRVGQTRGAVPLRLVLEPVLPARRLAAARVDGRDAELDARPAGERILVPVQLMLDQERSLELHVGNEDHDPADRAG